MKNTRLPQFLSLTSLFIFLVFNACTAEEAYQKPEITLKKVTVTTIYQNAVDLEATLDIFNPNDTAGRVLGYRYQLDLEGHKMATGEDQQPFTVPAQKSSRLLIPATIHYKDLNAFFPEGLLKQNLKYVLSGTVFLEVFFWKHPVPFTYEGTINLAELVNDQIRSLFPGF
jgi:LEA14-like dessication related protein